MGNQFLTVDQIAKRALATLVNDAVFAHVVHRDFESEFAGTAGSKVLIRKPAVFEAKSFNRASGIEIQDASEGQVEVELDDLLDVSFVVTDEDMSLTIDDFSSRLLVPAMQAIVEGVEAKTAGLVADITETVEDETVSGATLAKAGAILTSKHVPLAERVAIIDPMRNAEWVTKAPFNKVNESGDGSGLRDARLGKAYGFDTYQSASLTDEGVAFHKSALALVTRTLSVPHGVDGAVASHNGFGVRVVRGYDISKKQQTVSVDLLVGATVIDEDRAVRITGVTEDDTEGGED